MIQDQITGEEKEDGTFAGNVYGTYVHASLTGRGDQRPCGLPGQEEGDFLERAKRL